MSQAQRIAEVSPTEPVLVGAGPHVVATFVPATHCGIHYRLLLKDVTGSGATNGELVYHALVPITIYKPNFVALGAIVETYGAAGWTALGGSPTVALSAAVANDEIVVELLVPDGYSLEVSFELCGIAT